MLLEIAQIVIKIRKIILKNKAILEKKIGLNTSRKEERNYAEVESLTGAPFTRASFI
jgi:hypothetical protein